MTNSIYLEKYKGLIECYEHHGGQPGLQEIRVQAKLDTLAADPAAPTDVKTAQAREAAREEYLAVLLIRLSDPKRYSTLIVNSQNNHTRGTDEYPTTIAKAYDMLVHYRNPSRQPRMDRQDMDMSFYNEDDGNDRAHTYQSQADQRGRGGGKGCGHGNCGRGGRDNNQGRGNMVTNMEGRNKQLISMNMKVYIRIVNLHLTLVMYPPPIHLSPTPYT